MSIKILLFNYIIDLFYFDSQSRHLKFFNRCRSIPPLVLRLYLREALIYNMVRVLLVLVHMNILHLTCNQKGSNKAIILLKLLSIYYTPAQKLLMAPYYLQHEVKTQPTNWILRPIHSLVPPYVTNLLVRAVTSTCRGPALLHETNQWLQSIQSPLLWHSPSWNWPQLLFAKEMSLWSGI